MSSSIAVSPIQAKDILAINLQADLVTMMKGSPSTGKSSIIKDLADEYGMKLIDLRLAQCDPTDLLGFPFIDKETDRARYVPMSTFPLEGDPLPKDDQGNDLNGWILFLDEMNSADRAVQKASYKLLLDREVGEHKLHPKVRIVAAGNLETDGAIVEEMSTALQSRICHLKIIPDHKAWLDWARKAGVDYRITSFIEFKPDCLYTFNPETSDGQDTYACYRTWEFANKQLQLLPDVETNPNSMAIFTGSISEGPAREFLAYLRFFSKIPKVSAIIANPLKTAVPKEPGHLFALSGSLGQHADAKNIGPLMEYVQRISIEFQVITLREMLRRDRNLQKEKPIIDWVTKYGKELF